MVAYAAADPFSYLLTKASKDAAMENGILKAYKDNKAYNEPVQRVVKTAETVCISSVILSLFITTGLSLKFLCFEFFLCIYIYIYFNNVNMNK